MYSKGCPIDSNLVLWVEQQIDLLETSFPNVGPFIQYLKEHWLLKARMWCVGNWNIPHVGQDTNSSMESFHNNMKKILYSSRKKIIGCKMEWLI